MSPIDRLLGRLGWVRLRDFGLTLTPEGAIVDPTGAIVASRGAAGFVAPPPIAPMFAAPPPAFLPPPSVPTPPPRPALAAPAPAPVVPAPAHVAAPPPVPVPPAHVAAPPPVPVPPAPTAVGTPPTAYTAVASEPPVAAAPVVDDDDWEWTIAMARARAAEADVVQAVAADPIRADAWPQTEQIDKTELTAVDEPSPMVEVVPRQKAVTPAKPIVRVMQPKPQQPLPSIASASKTVIPVPSLPTARPSAIAPVVKSGPAPVAPRRFAKGTGPVVKRSVEPAPHAPSDDTQTSVEIAVPLPHLPGVSTR